MTTPAWEIVVEWDDPKIGLACTLLDSALGCAAHTLLPAGTGYTSMEIKINYHRPIHADSGPLTCIGRVNTPGRRVTFAEGEI